MKHALQMVVLIFGFSLFATPLQASSDVDFMSNIEVSEYASRMADVMAKIKTQKLCETCDINCERAQYSRYGVSYDDRESVKRRLALMIGRLY